MKKFIAAMMLAGAVAGLPTSAQAQGIGAELTAGKAEGVWGAELGLGYAFELGPIAVRPVAGAFVYKGDDTRYYMDQMSNGQSRCRDTSNGQFAKRALCNDAAAMFYGKVEATVTLSGVAEVGAGARYMDGEVRPYGLVAIPLGPKLKLIGSGGDRYFSAGLRLGF
jgi:hypothetical protein